MANEINVLIDKSRPSGYREKRTARGIVYRHGRDSRFRAQNRDSKDASGVPFDIVVDGSTRIKSGQRELTFGDLLSADKVTVEFIPEQRGDVAESIQVDRN